MEILLYIEPILSADTESKGGGGGGWWWSQISLITKRSGLLCLFLLLSLGERIRAFSTRIFKLLKVVTNEKGEAVGEVVTIIC